MHKLWEDHITWTRLYIISVAADLPDKDANAARLLQNQTDLGNAIKALYGEDEGNQLTALLKTPIQGAVDILAAAKRGIKPNRMPRRKPGMPRNSCGSLIGTGRRLEPYQYSLENHRGRANWLSSPPAARTPPIAAIGAHLNLEELEARHLPSSSGFLAEGNGDWIPNRARPFTLCLIRSG